MKTVPRWIHSCRLLALGSVAAVGFAQPPATPAPVAPVTPAAAPAVPTGDYVKAHYTKYEFRIPMRDGKKLFTSVYVPKDDSQSYARATAGTTTHDVLVCHGNVIRWFVCKALGVDLNQWTRMDIANASLTVITIRSDGTTRLEIFGEVAHLPIAKQTWSGKGPGWAAPAK